MQSGMVLKRPKAAAVREKLRTLAFRATGQFASQSVAASPAGAVCTQARGAHVMKSEVLSFSTGVGEANNDLTSG